MRSSVCDAVLLVPQGWDIGPPIPMGLSPWLSWMPDPIGNSTKGDLYTYIQDKKEKKKWVNYLEISLKSSNIELG